MKTSNRVHRNGATNPEPLQANVKVLRRAAALINEYAKSIYDANTLHGEWDEVEDHKYWKKLVCTASKLRDMSKQNQSPRRGGLKKDKGGKLLVCQRLVDECRAIAKANDYSWVNFIRFALVMARDNLKGFQEQRRADFRNDLFSRVAGPRFALPLN